MMKSAEISDKSAEVYGWRAGAVIFALACGVYFSSSTRVNGGYFK